MKSAAIALMMLACRFAQADTVDRYVPPSALVEQQGCTVSIAVGTFSDSCTIEFLADANATYPQAQPWMPVFTWVVAGEPEICTLISYTIGGTGGDTYVFTCRDEIFKSGFEQ